MVARRRLLLPPLDPPPPSQVERHAVKGLLCLVERERRGDGVDRALLQSLLRMLHSLGSYAEAFQRPFLEESNRFYRVEGGALMLELGVPEYLKHCEVGGEGREGGQCTADALHCGGCVSNRPL